MKKISIILIILAIMLSFSGCYERLDKNVPTPRPSPEVQSQSADEGVDYEATEIRNTTAIRGSLSAIVQKVSPAVVGLTVQYSDKEGLGLGSGVIAHKDGYIITNFHVAGNANSIEIILHDATKVPAQIIWADAALDLAIVKAEGGPYYGAKLGSAESAEVGDSVLAFGTPLALKFQHTVTSGIVSAKNRTLSIPSEKSVSFMEDLLQTDASINPGNSGGPLVNMRGEVIGINTLKVTDAEGLGFAIPIDICIPIVDHIVQNGVYETPYLGVLTIDKAIAAYLGENIESGVSIRVVDVNSPGYASGLRQGDVIEWVNSIKVDSVLDLRKEIYKTGVGGTIHIEFTRDGAQMSTGCTLGKK